ncbi:DNA methyltransferase [Micromonospora sp. NPDC007230]|uniref:DNA methyltransferase n=1 Tax=Micromonospora sp. NPDC007230 TaxID=3364237 RepID=UPI0036772930
MARRKIETGQWLNKLYYGDNLDVLREHIPSESVDLVYLDPPFNSNRSYNVLFKEKGGDEAQAQIEAFDDTWTWSHEAEALYIDLLNGDAPNAVKDALEAMRKLLGDNDVLAYLVMMTARLIELRRVLKPTGSLYLHCDPTASHYLKILLDAIFDARNFRNEIIWQRTNPKGLMTRRLPNNHDVILGYAKSEDSLWNEDAVFQPYDENDLDERTKSKYRYRDPDGRLYRLASLLNPNPDRPNLTYEFLGITRVWRWTRERMQEAYEQGIVVQTAPGRVPQMKRYLEEQRGRPIGDIWTDILPINSRAAERLGYPTQKPLALLERILAMASSEGSVVLDPFAGCGTTIDAAQKLGRRWVGIDVTTLAIDLIDARLRHTYGEGVRKTYEVLGIPRDLAGAQALFKRSPFEFERWCVMTIDGQPNEKQVGDRGIDGVIRFPIDGKGNSDKILVSVKGGATNPAHVRDLIGTVQSQRAGMGVFICMQKPTKAMIEAANHSGLYSHPANGQKFPRVQLITVEELLQGKRPNLPNTLLPYFQAQKRVNKGDQGTLFG